MNRFTQVRFASRKIKHKQPEKIGVQLLQDLPSLGARGEVVKVRPAYMRNFLHQDNKACYMTNGPRIPVVERVKPVKVQTQTQKPAPAQEPAPEAPAALSLNDLSNLFNSMRSNRSKKNDSGIKANIDTETSGLSSIELKEAIPDTIVVALTEKVTLPVEKSEVAQSIFKISGIKLDEADLRLRAGKTTIASINEKGSYTLQIQVPAEGSSVDIKVRVQ